MKEADALLARYDKETKLSYKDILAKRPAKFREYQDIPFPKKRRIGNAQIFKSSKICDDG